MSQPVTPQLIHTMECPIAKVCCCSRESPVLPIPENAFFEQAVFDQDLSQGLLELTRLSLELLDLVRARLTRRVAGEPFLARLQELLRPTVVQVLIDPFLAA